MGRDGARAGPAHIPPDMAPVTVITTRDCADSYPDMSRNRPCPWPKVALNMLRSADSDAAVFDPGYARAPGRLCSCRTDCETSVH